GGGRRERAMPEPYEIEAALIAQRGVIEDFVRLHVEKAEAHGAVSHDAFEVPHSTATAEFLGRIERHHLVAALPNTVARRIDAESDAVPQGPNANQPVELIAARR